MTREERREREELVAKYYDYYPKDNRICATLGRCDGAETEIADDMSGVRDGMLCITGYICPYCVEDVYGRPACYYDMYWRCFNK